MKYIVGGIVLAAAILGIALWLRGAPDVVVIEPATAPVVEGPQNAPTAQPDTAPDDKNKTTTKNGMTIETTKEGTGAGIVNGQIAVMQYTGTLTDGSVFDATSKRGGKAFEFTLGAGQVIKGWDQGILGMKVGEERTLTIPPELGYGPNGYPPVIPQNATLIFTVKLEAIK
ncbi:MAG TPA: FKBP-type peptidyl-prolyl cis-trans isomerase [Candidatus Paceibacterota bacterium]